MVHYFSSDPSDIFVCEGTGIGYSQIKVLCTAHGSNLRNKILYPFKTSLSE